MTVVPSSSVTTLVSYVVASGVSRNLRPKSSTTGLTGQSGWGFKARRLICDHID